MRRWLLRALLTLAAVAAGAWLWHWSQPGTGGRGLTGGPLFTADLDALEALEIRRPAGTTVLERAGGGWRLTGLVDDPFVDPERTMAVLGALMAGQGAPVLAGTEPDARRFGFGGEGSFELVLHLEGGVRERLALGDVSEVGELIYASGAGRPGVFGIGGGLYAQLAGLPDSIRLQRLLPRLALADLDSLALGRRGGDTWRFAPDAAVGAVDRGRWWLRWPAGVDGLAGQAARYHGWYGDRQRRHGGALWLLADVRRLREAVFRASDTAVLALPGPQDDQPHVLAGAGLDPPYRTLALHRRAGEPWTLALGELQEGTPPAVFVRRASALVIARGEALHPLEGPLAEFLDLGALSFRPEVADSLRLDTPARPVLWARKAADPAARREALDSVWDAVVPPGWALAFDPEAARNQAADLQLALDRLPATGFLPPAPADPLADGPRWRLRVWLPGGGEGAPGGEVGEVAEVWFGELAGTGQAAVWTPATGKVALIDAEFLVTLRNLQFSLKRQ